MSTEAGPKGKGGRASANANNDADSIMPLLFATIGNPTISFKKMAAMDELNRTESSLEHRFRKWRQKGREIAAKYPETAGTLSSSSTGAAGMKKPRAPSKQGTDSRGNGSIEKIEAEDGTDKEARAVKQEPDDMSGIGPSIKGNATTSKSIKKRAASGDGAAVEHQIGESPAKKVKVVKKGTAKVVKKTNPRAYSGSEDEDSISENEKEAQTKGKGKGKGTVAAARAKGKATGPAKASKGKAVGAAKSGQILIFEDEDAEVDTNSGDDQHDGLIEMQFDEAA